jgi:hypothetical protein
MRASLQTISSSVKTDSGVSSAREDNSFPTRQVTANRTACDMDEGLPIIPRISGVAEFSAARFLEKFPVTDDPGYTGTKSQEQEVIREENGNEPI